MIVLMGLASAEDVLEGLASEGRAPDTPAVAVSRASLSDERMVVGTLATLAERIRASELRSPATLIVGEVARRLLENEGGVLTGERNDEYAAVADGGRAVVGVA